jgi:hypothetical protein
LFPTGLITWTISLFSIFFSKSQHFPKLDLKSSIFQNQRNLKI